MSDQQKDESSLAEEFRQLGENLTRAMRAAWDSPERKRLEGEIAGGVAELGRTLREEANRLTGTQAGQRVREGAEEMGGRLREELVSALRAANTQLAEAANRLSSRSTGYSKSDQAGQETGSVSSPQGMADQQSSDATTPGGDTGHSEVHPDDVQSQADTTQRQEVHPDDVES